MTQAGGLVSLLPPCIQAAALEGIASTNCGADIVCICSNSKFLSLLQVAIKQNCGPADVQKILDSAKQLCTSAIPSLKDSRQSQLNAIIAIFLTLATTSVILRLMSRSISKVKFWWDDYLIIVALIFIIGEDANVFVGIHFGLGKHIIVLSVPQIIAFTKTFWATQFLFGLSLTCTKLSILFFYHRIFPSRRFAIVSIITGCVMIAWLLSLVITVVFTCSPIRFFWDKSIPNGRCLNQNAISYGMTGANIITDFIVLCLPIPPLSRLQMPLSRKLTLVGMFVVGAFVCIAGVVRIPLLVQVDQTDVTWTIVNAGIWINVESNIGIVCACLPTLGPLVRALRPRKTRSKNGQDQPLKPFNGDDRLKMWNRMAAKSANYEGETLTDRVNAPPSGTWYSITPKNSTGEDQVEELSSLADLTPAKGHSNV